MLIRLLTTHDPRASARQADITRFTGLGSDERSLDTDTVRTLRAATVDDILMHMDETFLAKDLGRICLYLFIEGRLDSATIEACLDPDASPLEIMEIILGCTDALTARLYRLDRITFPEVLRRLTPTTTDE